MYQREIWSEVSEMYIFSCVCPTETSGYCGTATPSQVLVYVWFKKLYTVKSWQAKSA